MPWLVESSVKIASSLLHFLKPKLKSNVVNYGLPWYQGTSNAVVGLNMKVPPEPCDEQERLKELVRLDAFRSINDDAYLGLTSIAAYICNTPMAAISLIDSDRQWFKARYGTVVDSTPRSVSFCGHVIAGDEIIIINNAHEDPRFHDNPLVTQKPGITFYAGAPLTSSRGHNLGTLCVMDSQYRELNPTQIFSLKTLARQIIYQLEATLTAADLNFSLVRFQTFLNHLNFGIMVEDESRTVVFINESFCSICGIVSATDAMIGMDCRDLFRSMDSLMAPRRFSEEIENVLEERKPVTKKHLSLNDGRELELDYIPLFANASYRGSLWLFKDVTSARRAEINEQEQRMKMVAMSKFAAIGEMAAGIAHEVNNPLAIIHAKAHRLITLTERNDLDAEIVKSYAQSIKDTCERISKIVNNLRAFAGETDYAPFELSSTSVIINDTLSLCESRFRFHGIRLDIEPGENRSLWCRPVPIVQVLFNLLKNAFDAVEPGGSEKWVALRVEGTPSRVRFWVSNSGPLIPENLRDKIFLPFVTTKALGKGTGLGLSLSLGIVSSHGGRLYLDEKQSHTTFIVDLPRFHSEVGSVTL